MADLVYDPRRAVVLALRAAASTLRSYGASTEVFTSDHERVDLDKLADETELFVSFVDGADTDGGSKGAQVDPTIGSLLLGSSYDESGAAPRPDGTFEPVVHTVLRVKRNKVDEKPWPLDLYASVDAAKGLAAHLDGAADRSRAEALEFNRRQI